MADMSLHYLQYSFFEMKMKLFICETFLKIWLQWENKEVAWPLLVKRWTASSREQTAWGECLLVLWSFPSVPWPMTTTESLIFSPPLCTQLKDLKAASHSSAHSDTFFVLKFLFPSAKNHKYFNFIWAKSINLQPTADKILFLNNKSYLVRL